MKTIGTNTIINNRQLFKKLNLLHNLKSDSVILPELKTIHYILLSALLQCFSSLGQKSDSLPFQLFPNRVVLYTDIGFNSAPFSFKDNYELGVGKLKYKNNLRAVLGFGIAYKWFGLRIGFALPGDILAESKYGKTEYYDGGLKFNIKQTFCNIDFRTYTGYSIKNSYKWNDTLSKSTPNDIRPNTRSTSINLNVWWFLSKKFNMKPALGTTGHFTGESKTWYFRTSMNFFGVVNDRGALVPTELSDTTDRQNAHTIGAFDLGLIPGYAYGNRINNWQFCFLTGLGGVIQSKYYIKGETTRSFLGIAPRIDLRVMGGYSKPSFFVLLQTDFDFLSANIQKLSYNQAYYNIKLVAGVRIQTKKSRLSESEENQN